MLFNSLVVSLEMPFAEQGNNFMCLTHTRTSSGTVIMSVRFVFCSFFIDLFACHVFLFLPYRLYCKRYDNNRAESNLSLSIAGIINLLHLTTCMIWHLDALGSKSALR